MKTLATAVDAMAWWLDDRSKVISGKKVLSYVGVPDIRYPIIFFAAIKAGWTTLLISPRNSPVENLRLLREAKASLVLYADLLESVIKGIEQVDPASSISFLPVPSRDEILGSPSTPYIYDALFADIKNEKCMILHSSGSTGSNFQDIQSSYILHTRLLLVKTWIEIYLSQKDVERRMLNSLILTLRGDFTVASHHSMYASLNMPLLAGTLALIILPVFYTTATAVWGPATVPPNGSLVSSIMKQMTIRAHYLPPFILEQWASEPDAYKQAESLDFVVYAGGPLAPGVGQRLSEYADVCQMYGSLEVGQVQMLVAQPGEWQYLEPNPVEECDMQEIEEGSGLYEMVLHQDEKFRDRRTLSHTFPDVKEWRTKDLFTPHPTKKGLCGYKVFPLPMEISLQADPNISGALVIGNGRSGVALVIEPAPPVRMLSKDDFMERIWPSVVTANASAASYAKVQRSHIILTDPDIGFLRTPKGTVVRKLSETLYTTTIDSVFNGIEDDGSEAGSLEKIWAHETKNFIRSAIQAIRPDSEIRLKDDDDFFITRAMDSLNVVELAQKLKLALSNSMSSNDNTLISWRLAIYESPTINGLTKAILSSCFVQTATTPTENSTADDIFEELKAKLPERNMRSQEPSPSSEGQHIVLLGARGRLGPFIVKALLDSPSVASLTCLDRARGASPSKAFQECASELGISIDSRDPRLHFITVDISKTNLNIPQEQLDFILKNVNVMIHNLWAVNFAYSLASFKSEMFKGFSSMIEIANSASSQPRVVFSSSIGSVQKWAARISSTIPLPEDLISSPDLAAATGYAQAKQVAERVLATAGKKLQLPISILRIGFIGGQSIGPVKWQSKDTLRSLALLSKATKVVPNEMGEVDYIPVDVLSNIIRDVALREKRELGAHFYNLVHPKPVPFTTLADALQSCIPFSRQVTFAEWVDHLSNLPDQALSQDLEAERVGMLPFFQALKAMESPPLQVDTTKAQAISEHLANLEPLGPELFIRWFKEWV
ncbi:hypothetical protein N7540_007250 [Penicillium herquei]|nr:hypothetical protein N7540_007250 [Penicillium herquei]